MIFGKRINLIFLAKIIQYLNHTDRITLYTDKIKQKHVCCLKMLNTFYNFILFF